MSQPIVCVASNTASLAKVHLLLRHGIQSDQVRAVHVIPLAFPVFSEDEPTLAVPRLVSIAQRFCLSCQRYTAYKLERHCSVLFHRLEREAQDGQEKGLVLR